MTRMVRHTLWSVTVLAASLPAAIVASAGHGHRMTAIAASCGPDGCGPAAAAPSAPQVVTKTVMVPQIAYTTITVSDIVCRPEVRQRTVTMCKLVPETKAVTYQATVLVPENRTQTVAYTECRMTDQDITRQATVLIPHTETRQGVRMVCKPVQAQEMRTVCKDQGHVETKSFVDGCGCTRTCQVWVPNVVTEQVQVTVFKPQFVEEPYSYEAVVCRPETRNITERIPKPVYETKTREMSYVVGVPKQVEKQVPQTTFRPVLEEKVVNYTELVPVRVERQVTVAVCTMVPKKITCTVPGCGNGCGPGQCW
jgi:hypothetical protein